MGMADKAMSTDTQIRSNKVGAANRFAVADLGRSAMLRALHEWTLS